MANQELLQIWEALRREFDYAQSLLPAKPAEAVGSLARLAEWLDHNELDLALNELEALGEDNAAGPEFWLSLRSAAARMSMSGRAEQLGRRAVDLA